MLVFEGKNVTAPQKIANIQVNYFSKKVKKLMDAIPDTNLDPLCYLKNALERWGNVKTSRPLLKFRKITDFETLEFLKNLEMIPPWVETNWMRYPLNWQLLFCTNQFVI